MRSEVMASTVRPGMTSGGQKSDVQPTMTKSDEGTNDPRTWMRLRRRRTSKTLMQAVFSVDIDKEKKKKVFFRPPFGFASESNAKSNIHGLANKR